MNKRNFFKLNFPTVLIAYQENAKFFFRYTIEHCEPKGTFSKDYAEMAVLRQTAWSTAKFTKHIATTTVTIES